MWKTFAVKVCSDHCELLRQFISDQTKLDSVQWKCIWRGSTMPLWTESQYLIADHPRTKWSEENGNTQKISLLRILQYCPRRCLHIHRSHILGGIQVYFHFMSSHLFYAQTFPHSTITNILEKNSAETSFLESSFDIFAHIKTFSLFLLDPFQ